jgi:acetyltransferase
VIGTTPFYIVNYAMYPSDYVESVTLRDGTGVTIRPIRPDDAPGLQVTFTRLSSQTVYLRFFETFKQLSDKQATYFANVDYHDSMALVAEVMEAGEDSIIAVARYDMLSDSEPGAAESAIVVRDDYQNRGLGTIIMIRLLNYAREHGVTSFLATIHASNARIMNFVKRSGFPFERKMIEPGIMQVRVILMDAIEE